MFNRLLQGKTSRLDNLKYVLNERTGKKVGKVKFETLRTEDKIDVVLNYNRDRLYSVKEMHLNGKEVNFNPNLCKYFEIAEKLNRKIEELGFSLEDLNVNVEITKLNVE